MDFFSKLPRDVILKILSRNRIGTILDCKLVCKSWLDLIETSDFVRCHLPNSIAGVLIHHVGADYADTDVFKILELEDSVEKEQHNLPCITGIELKCRNIFGPSLTFTTQINGSIDGLLFVRNPYTYPDAYYICNPITNECIRLPKPESIHENSTIASYGFGVSRLTGQYKVVKVSHYRDREPSMGSSLKRVCQVYTLGMESWRSSTLACEMLLDSSCYSSGKLWNENLHWLARDSDESWWISCFDLETELFTVFRAPLVKSRADLLHIGVVRDRLCLCHSSSIYEVHIYLICSDDGDEKLWNKEYVIGEIPVFVDKSFEAVGAVYVVKAFANGDLLLARDDSFLFYYADRTKSITLVNWFDTENAGYFEAVSFSPSLITLKDFETGNAKVFGLRSRRSSIRL